MKVCRNLLKDLKKNWILWAFFLPVIAFYITFSYVPMYGILLAFKEYKIKLGILGSPWVGFKHFERFFSSYNIKQLIGNTLGINFYSLAVGFPIPIIFALLLNYLTHTKLKRTVQMVSYAPYFISTVVLCGMLTLFLDSTGFVNRMLNAIGIESIGFLVKPEWFKSVYVWSGVWQGMGWNAIIYISALAGVDYEMHEAAIIDGATKLQRIRYIDLPSIQPTIIMLFIMNLGGIMGVGFEKVFLLMNDLNASAADVISTYTYRIGLVDHNYGFSTAVGLFNTLINLAFLITANYGARKVTGESLW